ncbi:hypothetical protein B0J11DRAFT_133491 [Dendryphion nanum]|uniref:Uncharacterized protein n=1 Tax=Dendryphion nanum TaxID=256645 RepID=A0A9P9IC50_9PLEO|nr:hypothetical protein B0J11DRAFT_133491 [Dendryphion nanum]
MRQPSKNLLITGLDACEIECAQGDLLEPLPEGYDDLQQRAAKRRKIEVIANECLRGKRPYIMSAQLKGPFEGTNWKNPWRRKEQSEQKTYLQRSRSESHSGGNTQDTGSAGGHNSPREEKVRKGPAAGRSNSRQTAETTIPSNQPNAIQRSGRREDSSEWLKRRAMRPVREERHMKPSATPSRQGKWPCYSSRDLQLAPPKVALPKAHSSTNTGHAFNHVLEHSSGASASIIICSPVKEPTSTLTSPRGARSSRRNTAVDRLIPTPTIPGSSADHMEGMSFVNPEHHAPRAGNNILFSYDESTTNHIQEHESNWVTSSNGIAVPIDPSEKATTRESHLTGPLIQSYIQKNMIQSMTTRTPSREEIQISAERCAVPTPKSSTFAKEPPGISIGCDHEDATLPLSEKQRTESAWKSASSSSFTYQMVEHQPKNKKPLRSKPRPVTFNSSPAVSRNSAQHAEPLQEDLEASRHSNYSTQAALMLAQLEFQEETILSLSSNTPRPPPEWPNDANHGQRPSSPEVTPFRKFNAQLETDAMVDAENNQDLPMSTQDLLNLASPFAFSAIKRCSVLPKRSSLRFAVHSNHEGERHADHVNGKKSPTSSTERVPLKDRNGHISLKRTTTGSEKGSQESPNPSQPYGTQEVDLQASLDSDLDFTNQFLANLEGMI